MSLRKMSLISLLDKIKTAAYENYFTNNMEYPIGRDAVKIRYVLTIMSKLTNIKLRHDSI